MSTMARTSKFLGTFFSISRRKPDILDAGDATARRFRHVDQRGSLPRRNRIPAQQAGAFERLNSASHPRTKPLHFPGDLSTALPYPVLFLQRNGSLESLNCFLSMRLQAKACQMRCTVDFGLGSNLPHAAFHLWVSSSASYKRDAPRARRDRP